MENSNSLLNDILKKLQETLNGYNCKSDTHVTDREALLSGKFSHDKERYTVIVQIKDQDYNPLPAAAGQYVKDDTAVVKLIPSLQQSFQIAHKSNCSNEEQVALRNKFVAIAAEAGKEFLAKVKK